jgi:hypothetical protein
MFVIVHFDQWMAQTKSTNESSRCEVSNWLLEKSNFVIDMVCSTAAASQYQAINYYPISRPLYG